MKTYRIPFLLFLLASGWLIMLSSCKERNDVYPPLNWSEYKYSTSAIVPRTISAMYYENDHSAWLGSRSNEGLLHFDGYKWNVLDKANTGIDFDSVTAITRDGNGNLWVGWKGGLASFNGSSWQRISSFDGLNVSSVVIEGIGNIKAGIKGESGGIAIRQNDSWIFYTPSNSAIPSGNVNAMSSDHEQALWLATTDKGIIRLKENKWEVMSTGIPLLSLDFSCITTAPDGSTWAGSAASQLIHFHDDTYTVLNTGTLKPITSVVIADDGSIWCSTLGAGMIRFDGINWTSFTMDNASLPTNDILTLAKGIPGNLLFSVPGGKVYMINQ